MDADNGKEMFRNLVLCFKKFLEISDAYKIVHGGGKGTAPGTNLLTRLVKALSFRALQIALCGLFLRNSVSIGKTITVASPKSDRVTVMPKTQITAIIC